jgi:predicted transcriptional regulator
MNKFTTPGGETLVVLPLADYERLVDAADIAAAKTVAANIAAGRDEMVPAEVVKKLLAGDNPIRVWREHRNMTARDLATAAGLSAAYISEIETGKKDGSVSAVKRIAEALGVDIDDLV